MSRVSVLFTGGLQFPPTEDDFVQHSLEVIPHVGEHLLLDGARYPVLEFGSVANTEYSEPVARLVVGAAE